jgi:hypothetical protein
MTAPARTPAVLPHEPPARTTRRYLGDGEAAAIVEHIRDRLPDASHWAVFDLVAEWKRLQFLLNLARPYLRAELSLNETDRKLGELASWIDAALTDVDAFESSLVAER